MSVTTRNAIGDFIQTPLIDEGAVSTYAIHTLRSGTGGNSAGHLFHRGRADANTTSNIAVIFISGTPNTLRILVEYSGTGGVWSFPDTGSTAWRSLVFTVDRTTLNPPSVYMDGVLQTLTQVTAPVGSYVAPSKPIIVGNREDLTRNWVGNIGKFAVWNRILSADEITAYSSGFDPLFFMNGLIYYSPFLDPLINLVGEPNTTTGGAVVTQSNPVHVFPSNYSGFLDYLAVTGPTNASVSSTNVLPSFGSNSVNRIATALGTSVAPSFGSNIINRIASVGSLAVNSIFGGNAINRIATTTSLVAATSIGSSTLAATTYAPPTSITPLIGSATVKSDASLAIPSTVVSPSIGSNTVNRSLRASALVAPSIIENPSVTPVAFVPSTEVSAKIGNPEAVIGTTDLVVPALSISPSFGDTKAILRARLQALISTTQIGQVAGTAIASVPALNPPTSIGVVEAREALKIPTISPVTSIGFSVATAIANLPATYYSTNFGYLNFYGTAKIPPSTSTTLIGSVSASDAVYLPSLLVSPSIGAASAKEVVALPSTVAPINIGQVRAKYDVVLRFQGLSLTPGIGKGTFAEQVFLKSINPKSWVNRDPTPRFLYTPTHNVHPSIGVPLLEPPDPDAPIKAYLPGSEFNTSIGTHRADPLPWVVVPSLLLRPEFEGHRINRHLRSQSLIYKTSIGKPTLGIKKQYPATDLELLNNDLSRLELLDSNNTGNLLVLNTTLVNGTLLNSGDPSVSMIDPSLSVILPIGFIGHVAANELPYIFPDNMAILNYFMKAGATREPIQFVAIGSNGLPINTASVSKAEFKIKVNDGLTKGGNAIAVGDPTLGRFDYRFDGFDTIEPGTYRGELVLTFNDGTVDIIPRSGHIQIQVSERL